MHIKTSNLGKAVLGYGDYTCNWGTHFAALYETEAERDEILFGFISAGIKNNDIQLYCPVEQSKEQFIQKFSGVYAQYTDLIKDPDVCIIKSAQELYYPKGIFSPWSMEYSLDQLYQEIKKRGRRNIRAIAEMTWILEAIPGTGHIMAYESILNVFISNKNWISICMYNINAFPGSIIMNVLRTHPFTISRGIITQNPFYIGPDEWLSKYAPEYYHTNN